MSSNDTPRTPSQVAPPTYALPPQWLVGPHAATDIQRWVTFDYATKTRYTFEPPELEQIVDFSEMIRAGYIPPSVRLPERYLIVARLYNFAVPEHARLYPLPRYRSEREEEILCDIYTEELQRQSNIARNRARNGAIRNEYHRRGPEHRYSPMGSANSGGGSRKPPQNTVVHTLPAPPYSVSSFEQGQRSDNRPY